jgi:DNA (cytosine-5)-methyltransferase 1
MLVLSLFPGIGLLDRAFEEEGFCVVRGPDLLWGGDIRNFHPPAGKFDGVIGGPPCQAFSKLRRLVEHQGYQVAENLIPEFERCVTEAQPNWFLMENVKAAPNPNILGYEIVSLTVNNRWVGGEQHRERRFNFGTRDGRQLIIDVVAFEAIAWLPTVLAGHGPIKCSSKPYTKRMSIPDMCEAQGLPRDFMDHAPFTAMGKRKVIGNGVPLPMGRAIAKAVREAIMAENGD